MHRQSSLDFELKVTARGEGYVVHARSPLGAAVTEFTRDFLGPDVEDFVLRLSSCGAGDALSDVELAKRVGEQLFVAVFAGEVGTHLQRSMDLARREGTRLCIRLRLQKVPELASLPWEYLYNRTENDFLALSALTPFVRYIAREPIPPLRVVPPLRILLAISMPRDYPPLDAAGERDKLERALRESIQGDLLAENRVQIDLVSRQDGESMLTALQRALRRDDYHIFHFVGHGHFDAGTGQGMLILEDTEGYGLAVSGEQLGNYLRDEIRVTRTLRLVVLNACLGGRPSRRELAGGVATALVQMGIPAVIAMQAEISDAGAIAFAQGFYGALADGWPLDLALTEGRKSIYAISGLEWGKPVLYTCTTDSRVFAVGPEPTRQETENQLEIDRLFAAGRAAMAAQSWRQAVEQFEAVLALDPHHRAAARYLELCRKHLQS